uniref:G-protein coupled receptors family 1 profile domain-containing protein n=1 Tax=Denticeps clupeoides TaxID=299321 RepID=A0AAY4AX48_9TELE
KSKNCHRIDELDFKYRAYTVTYLMVFPMGFLCNSAALVVFLFITPKKLASRVFMINLAFSDVGFSLTLPFRLIYYFRNFQWDFPDWLCRLCVFSFYLNLYTSVLFLTSLSVLRYIAVLHPFQSKIDFRRAVWISVGIWVFVALLSSPFFMNGVFKDSNNVSHCFEPRDNTSWERMKNLNYVGVILGCVIPFLIIVVCYSCILYRLLCVKEDVKKTKRPKRRTVYLVALILFTFLVCFMPYHVVRSVHLAAEVSSWDPHFTASMKKVLVVTLCLAASNSCLNPLMYYFAGESFRTAIRRASSKRLTSSFKQSINLRNHHPLPATLKESLKH